MDRVVETPLKSMSSKNLIGIRSLNAANYNSNKVIKKKKDGSALFELPNDNQTDDEDGNYTSFEDDIPSPD
jgi:hypothetical protein